MVWGRRLIPSLLFTYPPTHPLTHSPTRPPAPGYTHADFQTDVPLAPLSGAWRFSVRQFVAGRNARTSNVTRLFISVDPNFHNPKAEKFTGRLVLVDNRTEDIRSKCPLAMGTMTPSCQLSGVELDTTQLAKGPHKVRRRVRPLPPARRLPRARRPRRRARARSAAVFASPTQRMIDRSKERVRDRRTLPAAPSAARSSSSGPTLRCHPTTH